MAEPGYYDLKPSIERAEGILHTLEYRGADAVLSRGSPRFAAFNGYDYIG